MKAINASKMYCTVTMQVTYQVSWCYSSDVIQESAADISPQPSLLARDTVDLCFEP